MTKKHREGFFQEFQAHTLLKHGVLSRYVAAWIRILQQQHARLWIVDGFAGPGQDAAGNDGSPVLLAKKIQRLRRDGCEAALIAVEPERERFHSLQERLAAFDVDGGGQYPFAHLRNAGLRVRERRR